MTLLGVSTECHKSSIRTLHCGWVGTQTSSSLCDFWEFSSPVVDLCLALLEFHPMYVELNSAKYWKAYPKQFWNSFSKKSTFSISVGLALLNSYLCLLSSESAILYLECLCLCCILGSVSRWKASNQRAYLVSLLSKMWSSVASCSVPKKEFYVFPVLQVLWQENKFCPRYFIIAQKQKLIPNLHTPSFKNNLISLKFFIIL